MFLARPTLIAHRGSPSYLPEHTLEGYKMAISQGCDVIEPDLVITKDGILIVRHENEISETTNVADFPEFKDRKCSKFIDGIEKTGWFVEDFTLQELKLLRAKERIPEIRPGNVAFNGLYEIPTFQEALDLIKELNLEFKGQRTIGVYPETKHPSYFKNIGLPLEDRLIQVLEDNNLNTKDSPVFIQSFEVANLKELRRRRVLVPLVQLVDEAGTQPYDFVLSKDPRKSEDMLTKTGLEEIAKYADVVAPYKEYLIPRTANNNLGVPTELIAKAHSLGLLVHTWTFRPENHFLPADLKSSKKDIDKHVVGDGSVLEIQAFLKAGLDGFFSDASYYGRKAIDLFNTM
jgi:glycerophosphoryl diester phosphodiesterase